MEDFYRQKGAGATKLYQAKKWIGYFKVTLRRAGGHQADYLTQAIPD